MAKRRNNNGDPVSLFPFMSILACLIGILTLMISLSMHLKEAQNKGSTEEDKALAMENRDLQRKAETVSAGILRIEERARKENAAAVQIDELRDRKIVLRDRLDKLDKAKDPQKSDAALQKSVELMKREIAALKQERPALAKRLEELRKKLAELRNPPKKVESVMVRPGTSGARSAASLFFVECNSTGIVLIRGKGRETPIATAAIEKSLEYKSFLEETKRTRDSMVLFLIRKDGHAAYPWAAGIAENQFEVKTGKLPIPNNGEIDLSLFLDK